MAGEAEFLVRRAEERDAEVLGRLGAHLVADKGGAVVGYVCAGLEPVSWTVRSGCSSDSGSGGR